MNHNVSSINKLSTGECAKHHGNVSSSYNKGNIRERKQLDTRTISNDDVLRSSRRLDRFLSLLNEDEALILAKSRIAGRVEVSAAQWTKEKLVDMVQHNLAEVNIVIEHNGETLQIPKYSEKIIDLAPKLAVFRPAPELTINLSDLNPMILEKLYELNNETRKKVLTTAGKRLFKVFFRYYYNTIADLIRVRIEK